MSCIKIKGLSVRFDYQWNQLNHLLVSSSSLQKLFHEIKINFYTNNVENDNESNYFF